VLWIISHITSPSIHPSIHSSIHPSITSYQNPLELFSHEKNLLICLDDSYYLTSLIYVTNYSEQILWKGWYFLSTHTGTEFLRNPINIIGTKAFLTSLLFRLFALNVVRSTDLSCAFYMLCSFLLRFDHLNINGKVVSMLN
jgi:hypothetical protein